MTDNCNSWGLGELLLTFIFLSLCASFLTIPFEQNNRIKVRNDATEQVEYFICQEFSIAEGIIESPSIIIILDFSLNSFLNKGIELGASTVYIYEHNYYVFNSDLSMAWRYSINLNRIGFGGFNFEWGNP